jgi:putative ubiquitin-RnfH superfamily antitoxin RatB of RatAB toxin-antitoxin module
MALDEQGAELRVSVAYSPRAGVIDEVSLVLEAGATVRDALMASGLQSRHPTLALESASIGVWGALCRTSDLLRDRDRVEVYRPLLVDPKEARRLRYRGQARTKAKTKESSAK